MYRFERFVALRYLRAGRGQEEGRGFLRFVLIVAVAGVATGVAALLLALMVVRGFSREIENKIIGFGAHVQVESLRGTSLTEAEVSREALASFPGVVQVAPVVQEFILLRRSSRQIEGVSLWGTEALPAFLRENIPGNPFIPDSVGRPGIVLGEALARLLDVQTGDVVTAFTLPGMEAGAPDRRGLPRLRQFHVAALYRTALANYDEIYAFADLEEARSFLGYAPGEHTRFDLTLDDSNRAQQVASDIEDTFGFPVLASTVFQVFRNLFAWVELQQNIVPVVISVLVLVAAFNIVGILLMVILEKAREIAIFSSMGASAKRIRRLYLTLGLFIGVVGTLIGFALALGLAWLQLRFEIIPLPAEAYYLDRAPILIWVPDFLVVGGAALVLCLMAAYFPARYASRLEPLRIMRFR